MKKDAAIQKNVMEEIQHVPSVNSSEIGVSVKNGVVTLTGTVDSYPKKIAVERAVIKIKDVLAIAEDLRVKLNGSSIKTDSELAQAVLYALEWHSGLEPGKIRVLVENGNVTIEGSVEWNYQRILAAKTAGYVIGVREVINNLKLVPRQIPADLKEKIEAAVNRNANIHSQNLEVLVDKSKVTLKGRVRNLAEKREAEHSVWIHQGVTEVVNQLEYANAYEVSEAY